MKSIRCLIIWTTILLSCLLIFTFADDMAKDIQATESDVRVVYNGKEVSLGIKQLFAEGYNYLSVRALAELFDKNVEWNPNERKIIISDKPDPALEGLKTELDTKTKNIAELQDKVKKLENDIISRKKFSLSELQELINKENCEYESVSYRVILSGNEDEVRVKIEVDLSLDKAAWGHLSSNKKKEMIKEICNPISGEYGYAKINGYIKDISSSRKLATFYNTSEGDIVIGTYKNYSTISTLEDRINDNYAGYFKGIHFTFTLKGNENRLEYKAFVQKNKFEGKWHNISDSALKNLMKKLCGEINNEFRRCYINGYIYDTDDNTELAVCEQTPEGTFTFYSEQQ